MPDASPREPIVRTVLGDVAPSRLGVCTAHEHVFLRSPLLRGEELDQPDEALAEARTALAAGIDALVDWTPIGLGRRPRELATLARETGLHVVAATGLHRQVHYPAHPWVGRLDADALAELMISDLTVGVDANDWLGPRPDPTDVRAGMIKVGASLHCLTAVEETAFAAAAAAHAAVGAPVCVHTEHGTHGLEVVERLTALGVPAGRLVVAHLDRNPDPGLHAEIAAAGAYLEYDGPGRAKYHPDSTILATVAAMVERGHGERLLVGGDTSRRSALRVTGGGPGLAYAAGPFRARLRRELGEEVATSIYVTNPAQAFSFVPRG